MTDGLWAVLADVPAAGWDQSGLQAKLQDLGWVERAARAHEAVIERTMRAAPVVPLRMLTIYADEARAIASLRERAAAIAALAEAARDHHEWTVRVLFDPSRAQEAAREESLRAPRPATGQEFLLRKKSERDRTRAAEGEVRAATAALLAELGPFASRATERPADQPQLVAEATFLVPDERAGPFRERAAAGCARLDQLGARATLSGPWPAYHLAATLGEAR